MRLVAEHTAGAFSGKTFIVFYAQLSCAYCWRLLLFPFCFPSGNNRKQTKTDHHPKGDYSHPLLDKNEVFVRRSMGDDPCAKHKYTCALHKDQGFFLCAAKLRILL